jgi:hypothetical protein
MLGLLDLKTMGQSPPDFAPYLQATLEGFPFYCNTVQRTGRAVTLVAAATLGWLPLTATAPFPIGPPKGSVWWVRLYTLIRNSKLAAGEVAVVSPGAILSGQIAGYGVAVGPPGTGDENQYMAVGARDFWLMPGDTLGMFLHRMPAAGLTIHSEFNYCEFAY